ncbi:hypothetical protein LDENG_00118070, partial [Lucifuga dentata]
MSVFMDEEEDGSASVCLSMKSNWSKESPLNFRHGDSASVCVSMKSDWSKESPLNFRHGDSASVCVSMKSDWSKESPLNFSDGSSETKGQNQIQRPESVCVSMKSDRSTGNPPHLSDGSSDTKNRSRGAVEDQPLCCPLYQDTLKDPVSTSCGHSVTKQDGPKSKTHQRQRADGALQKLLYSHKLRLKSRCEHVMEGTCVTGSRTSFNRIYTELYITEGQSEEVNT